MAVNFGGKGTSLLSNASNGEYDVHFITNQSDWNRYDPICAKYMKGVLKSIPLKIDSIEVILADQYMILTTDVNNRWKPDMVRRADGVKVAAQANPVESLVQPHDELWRNIVFNDKMQQVIVVDRLIKNGRHYAIVYVLQSEKKGLPWAITFQYDVLDRHNAQFTGSYLDRLLDISIDALENDPGTKL